MLKRQGIQPRITAKSLYMCSNSFVRLDKICFLFFVFNPLDFINYRRFSQRAWSWGETGFLKRWKSGGRNCVQNTCAQIILSVQMKRWLCRCEIWTESRNNILFLININIYISPQISENA